METEFAFVLTMFALRLIVPVAVLFVLGSVISRSVQPVR